MTLQKNGLLKDPPQRAVAIALAALCVIAIIIFSKDIPKLSMLYVSADEMGYLGTAAWLNGLDWTGMMGKLYYYSYGYPLLLAPIFSFTTDPATVYRFAIMLNVLLSAAVLPLSYLTAQRLFPGANKWLTLVCCFCVTMYSANILQITMARNESLLFLLVWALLLLFLLLKKHGSLAIPIAIAALSFYAFMVHQRTVPLIISAGAVMFVMFIKKQLSFKQFLAFALTVVGMFILHTLLKDFFKSGIWQGASSAAHNDFSDMPRKIAKLFSPAGAASFLRVLGGQIFYMGAASFLIYYAGAGAIIPRAWRTLRHGVFSRSSGGEQRAQTDWGILFLVIAAVLTFAVSAIFLITPVRMDHIIYGRYNEIFMGPVLLYALLYLSYRKKPGLRAAAICAAIFVALGLLAKNSIDGLPNFATISSPGMAWMEPFFADGWIWVIAIPLAVFAGILLLTYMQKSRAAFCALAGALLCAFFIYAGCYPIEYTVLPAQQTNNQAVAMPRNYIQDSGITEVYAYGEGEDAWQFAFLQFALPKQPLIMLDSPQAIAQLQDGSTVVTTASGIFVPSLAQNADIVTSSGRYIVWNINHGAQNSGAQIPLSLFSTQTGKFAADYSGVRGEGEGYLLYGPYITVPAGAYNISISYSPLKGEGEVGHADVAIAGTPLNTVPINTAGLSALDIGEIKIPLTLAEISGPLEVRVYLSEGAGAEIYSVAIAPA